MAAFMRRTTRFSFRPWQTIRRSTPANRLATGADTNATGAHFDSTLWASNATGTLELTTSRRNEENIGTLFSDTRFIEQEKLESKMSASRMKATDFDRVVSVEVQSAVRSRWRNRRAVEQRTVATLRKNRVGEPRRDDLQHAGKAGDGGLDGIIALDRIGLEKVRVQAERWKATVLCLHAATARGKLPGCSPWGRTAIR